jgi:hypothetical protein
LPRRSIAKLKNETSVGVMENPDFEHTYSILTSQKLKILETDLQNSLIL